ncbi:MAG: enoyl-CoA hydratase/isomerase family protein [Protaetiibacter sp.]
MSDVLGVTLGDAVSRVTLTRPAAANTIGMEAARAFRDAVASVRAAGSRVLVIDALGSTFCGGGDVREVASAADPSAHLAALAAAFHEGLLALADLDAVVIAQVDGAVAGGGLGLVLHSDVAIASSRARFLTAYDRLGVTPDSGVTDLLPRAIGERRALEMTMLGRALDAATARDWGLVADVVEPDGLAATVDALAARLATDPVAHLAATRRLYRGIPTDHPARLADEARLIGAWAATPHARERIAAFAPKEGSDA